MVTGRRRCRSKRSNRRVSGAPPRHGKAQEGKEKDPVLGKKDGCAFWWFKGGVCVRVCVSLARSVAWPDLISGEWVDSASTSQPG